MPDGSSQSAMIESLNSERLESDSEPESFLSQSFRTHPIMPTLAQFGLLFKPIILMKENPKSAQFAGRNALPTNAMLTSALLLIPKPVLSAFCPVLCTVLLCVLFSVVLGKWFVYYSKKLSLGCPLVGALFRRIQAVTANELIIGRTIKPSYF